MLVATAQDTLQLSADGEGRRNWWGWAWSLLGALFLPSCPPPRGGPELRVCGSPALKICVRTISKAGVKLFLQNKWHTYRSLPLFHWVISLEYGCLQPFLSTFLSNTICYWSMWDCNIFIWPILRKRWQWPSKWQILMNGESNWKTYHMIYFLTQAFQRWWWPGYLNQFT